MATSQELGKIPGVRIIPITPAPLPGGGDFPVDLVIASTAEPERLVELAGTAGRQGVPERPLHVRRRRPQVRPAAGRGGLRPRQGPFARASTSREAGRDLSTMLGGNYVNRFSIQGRSYKVIPQIKRAERLTPDQLKEIYVTGGDGGLVPLSTFATVKTTTEPRELKRFQQLNAVRIQGVIPPGVALDQALGFLEAEAAKILPVGFTIDYAGESRQLRTEGKQVPLHLPALGDPHLPRARRAVRELPRSVHHPHRVGAARPRRGAALLVPRLHDAQHLQPGRAHHPGRPGGEERHPDRRVRQSPPGAAASRSSRR